MICYRTKATLAVLTLFFLFSCQKELDKLGPDIEKIRVFFVSTYAGSSLKANVDGQALQSAFNSPNGIASAADGTLFISDNGNNNIRKISPDGLVETITPVGSLKGPSGIEVGPDGTLYICESLNNRILRISSEGKISEVAVFELCDDNTHLKSTFNSPNGIAIAPDGSIYIADTFNNKIKKISKDGQIDVIAGSTAGYMDGKCAEAKFHYPFGIALDKDGSIYVSDYGNNTIRKISAGGIVSTIAGSTLAGNEDAKTGTDARFRSPTDLTIADDGTVYIADYFNSRIRAILTTGEVNTIAGTDDGFLDGVGITAKFHNPVALVIHKNVLYITDSNNSRIRKIILD